MSWLGKLGATLFSASNDNTLALANLKFVFALLKVEAPREFSPLGSALCQRRKIEAEDGSWHRTARKLSALFEQLIPNTPKLISAYGRRVSEIMDTPGVNPQGLNSHGPFKSFVGADATALWAAATSGVPAIALYLLAALLAHEWDDKKAVSIWVELVTERKKEIMEAYLENHLITESSLLSSRQDISRHELAQWDDSARSWLRSADQAKRREVNQFLLISENLRLGSCPGKGTYEKVLNNWREAMKGMENLLSGRPQSIMDRSIPTAILSWHLFPDLVVLSKEVANIKFKDELFSKSATCTIGIVSDSRTRHESSQWSLTLSHFQFYGKPVKVCSDSQLSRVEMYYFLVVVFGSLLSSWQVQRADILPIARWFETLWDVLKTASFEPKMQLRGFEWLNCVVEAARLVVSSEGSQDKTVLQLLEFGMRRAKRFLGMSGSEVLPLFGLGNPYIFSGLTEATDMECSIRLMREVAQNLDLDESQAVIVIIHNPRTTTLQSLKPFYYEFASAVPSNRNRNKRLADGQLKFHESHVRWISTELPESMQDALKSGRHQSKDDPVLQDNPVILSRIANIRTLGEHVLEKWEGDHMQKLIKSFWPQVMKESSGDFQCLLGNKYLGLWVRNDAMNCRLEPGFPGLSFAKSLMLKTTLPSLSENGRLGGLDLRKVAAGRLYDYLCCLVGTQDTTSTTPGVGFLAQFSHLPEPFIHALQTIAQARKVYSSLDDATISLKLVTLESPLANARWSELEYSKQQPAPTPTDDDDATLSDQDISADASREDNPQIPLLRASIPAPFTRQQAFACIAHFETGNVELDPDSLDLALALSIENSIYVPAIVVSDPYEEIPNYRMKRLTGNIGRNGISILIAPQHPQVREPSDCYNLVEHKIYDLQHVRREDNFKATSLNLHFTEWRLPLEDTDSRTIDQDVFFVESVISVLDRGKWVADLDILSIDFSNLVRIKQQRCTIQSHEKSCRYEYRCLDSWEEFLDAPNGVGMFRARKNWAARLAAVSILTQNDNAHCIAVLGPGDLCMRCLEETYDQSRLGLMENESSLPSFCID